MVATIGGKVSKCAADAPCGKAGCRGHGSAWPRSVAHSAHSTLRFATQSRGKDSRPGYRMVTEPTTAERPLVPPDEARDSRCSESDTRRLRILSAASGGTAYPVPPVEQVGDISPVTPAGPGRLSRNTAAGPDNTLGFAGYQFCHTTGLYAVRFRHYDPGLGRWLQRDPAGYVDGASLYEYVRSMPTQSVDPTGLATIGEAVASHCRAVHCNHITGWLSRSEQDKCVDKCRRNLPQRQKFLIWYRHELADMGWLSLLPDCPSSIKTCNGSPLDCDNGDWEELVNKSESWAIRKYHDGAEWCMRSRSFSGHAQQCCYDAAGGLITDGIAAGTPDRAAASYKKGLYLSHYLEDVEPFDWAWRFDDMNNRATGTTPPHWHIDRYLEVRPPNQGGGNCYK